MIGAQIAAYRKQKDLTQEQLGEMLGVSNRTVSKWESETSLPGVDMIPNIAEALGVTLDALFGIRSDPDEKDLSDLLRDTVRQELESLLPDAVENAIQKSCGNLPQPEKYELIVMSKDRSRFTKTCGEANIVSNNTSGSTGLLRCAFRPACMLSITSSSKAFAVNAMIGISFASGLFIALILRVASSPSISGIRISIRTAS